MRTLADQPPESLGAYIISMAEYPSDVLAVLLLQRRVFSTLYVWCLYLKL